MLNHERGLFLNTNGVIGQQGVPGLPSDNQWLGGWASPPWETYALNSNPSLSQLYVQPGPPYEPFNHGGSPNIYVNNVDIIPAGGMPYQCPPPSYAPAPSSRNGSQHDLGIAELNFNNGEFKIYPNPADKLVTIQCPFENVELTVSVSDVTGKVLQLRKITATGFDAALSLDLANGIYFIAVSVSNGPNIIQKLVIQR